MALAAALPCAPLLIVDLGDPKRFHHMLRVFKPHSPMSLGSWALTTYTAAAAVAGLREWVRARQGDAPLAGAAKAADGAAALVADVGVPLGLLVAGYTGVLLSTTAVPLWGRNPWLGALFSAGAVASGASATRLALAATAEGADGAAGQALAKVEGVARVTEVFLLGGFLGAAGEFAAPLTKGAEAKRFWGGAVAAGLAVPALLELLPVPKKAHRWLDLAASALAVFGAFTLRASITGAGRESAGDPEAARRASRKKKQEGNRMKVRWTQSSVRLRITPTELEAIVSGEPVREELSLPGGGHWAARVVPTEGETALSADGSDLTLSLSLADAQRLAAPDAEGVYFQQSGEPALRYLIEKDFPCVHPRASHAEEPATETFAEPEDFRARKSTA